MSPGRRPNDPDPTPIFLIPRIPGTGLLALIGVLLVTLTAVSAYMQLSASRPTTDAAPSAPDTAAKADDAPFAGRSVRILADPLEVLAHFGAETVGLEMWRAAGDRGGSVLFLLEDDGLWAHGVTDDEIAELTRAGFTFEEVVLEPVAP